MEFSFSDKKLVELYTKGKSRKLRVPPQVARKFIERVNRIEDADTILDLRVPPSMHFEKLTGHGRRFSIRVDQQWRLEFEIDFEDEAKTRGNVRVLALSKHYE